MGHKNDRIGELNSFWLIYIFEAILKWIFSFLKLFTASYITQIWLTPAKLTCPCNTLETSNSFANSDTGVVIDSEPHPSRMCKTSLLFAPLVIVFQLAVPLFRFTLRQHRKYDHILNTNLF